MNTPVRRGNHRMQATLGSLLLALTTTSLSCSKSVDHTYVDVTVTIDDSVTATQLYLVTSCEVQVTGPDMATPFNLPCRENKVPRDVGTFQWVSEAKSGSLQFFVTIFDANHIPIGRGNSDAIPVAPGKMPIKTTILVLGVVSPPGADGGTTDVTPGDSQIDQTTGTDVTAPDGGAPDQTDTDVPTDTSDTETTPSVDGAVETSPDVAAG